jgi:hypothetical protein
MQSSAGDRRKVWLFHVFGANARKHFAINAKLAIRAVIAGRVNAQAAENYEKNNQKGKREDTDLKLLRHSTF